MSLKKLSNYLLLAFVLGVAGSIYLVKYASDWLTQSSTELTQMRSDFSVLQAKKDNLDKAKRTLEEKETEQQILAEVVPTEKGQAEIIQELYAIASTANISIESIGFPASTLGSTAPRPAPTPAPATDTTTTTQGQTSDATAAPAPAPVKVISQATPVKDIPGIQSIDLTLGELRLNGAPDGASGMPYENLMNFIRQLERNRRTIQIRSLGITPTNIVNGVQFYSLDVSLTIFVRS